MLVDDNEIDNFINQRMIYSSGFAENVLVHTSSRSAIEYLKNLPTDGSVSKILPSVIFLDIDMPVNDGFQFLVEFKGLPDKILKKTKVIVLTNSINPVDIEKANNDDCVVDFINKPLSSNHLAKI